MGSFEDYLDKTKAHEATEQQRRAAVEKELEKRLNLFEHKIYQRIPGTNNSYREDKANKNTKTLKHAHVYARQNGSGMELYSVNIDGRGHDGSSGIPVPATHADYFRSLGYRIPPTNILECRDIATIKAEDFVLEFFDSNDNGES